MILGDLHDRIDDKEEKFSGWVGVPDQGLLLHLAMICRDPAPGSFWRTNTIIVDCCSHESDGSTGSIESHVE